MSVCISVYSFVANDRLGFREIYVNQPTPLSVSVSPHSSSPFSVASAPPPIFLSSSQSPCVFTKVVCVSRFDSARYGNMAWYGAMRCEVATMTLTEASFAADTNRRRYERKCGKWQSYYYNTSIPPFSVAIVRHSWFACSVAASSHFRAVRLLTVMRCGGRRGAANAWVSDGVNSLNKIIVVFGEREDITASTTAHCSMISCRLLVAIQIRVEWGNGKRTIVLSISLCLVLHSNNFTIFAECCWLLTMQCRNAETTSVADDDGKETKSLYSGVC